MSVMKEVTNTEVSENWAVAKTALGHIVQKSWEMDQGIEFGKVWRCQVEKLYNAISHAYWEIVIRV